MRRLILFQTPAPPASGATAAAGGYAAVTVTGPDGDTRPICGRLSRAGTGPRELSEAVVLGG
ncbi:MAG TPA: hypothetical protein VLA43_07970 [Longimicrobiales bacterium]|nr:hypothetical protein [Longimicrobiales bacterium]